MCEFLKGADNKDVKRIKSLEEQLAVEKNVADALFFALSTIAPNQRNEHIEQVVALYSRVLLARSNNDYETLHEDSHRIIGVLRGRP